MAQKKKTNNLGFKSSTKATTGAYNAKNKVRIAQEALEKQKTKVNDLKIDYKTAVAQYNSTLNKQVKPSSAQRASVIVSGNELVRGRNTKGRISQAVTDRSRTASRAEGILNRENKKIK